MGRARYFAFFDVDHTLIDGSTGLAFAVELFRAGIIDWRDIAHVGAWQGLYTVGLVTEIRLWHLSTERLVGKREAPIRQACKDAYRRSIRHVVYREALDALAHHRAQGGEPVIVSAGPRFAVLELARDLGVERTATCWANTVDGRVHDLAGVRILYGPAKRDFARQLCTEHNVQPADCWAYGDSRSDFEMLDFVGHPVVVNPRRPLRRMARRHRWPIVRWKDLAPPPAGASPFSR